MQSFKFRLQSVLDLRKKEEEQQQLKLAEAIAKYDFERELLDQLNSKQIDYLLRLRELIFSEPTGFETVSIRDYLPVLKDRIDDQVLVVRHLQQKVENERNCLIEMVKKRKVLENLRARQFQVYQKEALRQEQIIIDEMANQLYVRKEFAHS